VDPVAQTDRLASVRVQFWNMGASLVPNIGAPHVPWMAF
jgi:hypothetical protein